MVARVGHMAGRGRYLTEAFTALDRPLTDLLGDKAEKDLSGLGIETVGDLLRHLPRRFLAGTELSDLASLREGDEVAVIARVKSVGIVGYEPKLRVEAVITDGKGDLRLTFFGRKRLCEWWSKALSRGERGIFAGKVGTFHRQPQLTHPDFVMIDHRGEVVGSAAQTVLKESLSDSDLVGLYPASAKVKTWTIAALVKFTLDALGELEDPWPEWVRLRAHVPELTKALWDAHRPHALIDERRARRRLVFDEALGTQLAMAKRRQIAQAQPAIARQRIRGGLLESFDARLPFTLTAGQRQVGEEIFAALAQSHPMQRLLQGDVGSGKTLVALRAMLAVVDAGGQAALLAPTEVLAQQHTATLRSLLGDLADGGTLVGPEIATSITLLTGSMSAVAKRAARAKIAGEAGIVVGTHALLSEGVEFRDLGLVVVDEQHRFGVEQRALLAAKAAHKPHVLVMTATPIPRTVAMSVFGDLDISSLTEIPAGRSEVSTVVVDVREKPAWVVRAWQRVREEVAQGRQAFIVAPRIGISKKLTADETSDDGESVIELFEELRAGALAGLRVGLLHGQLPADEREATMGGFACGELDVLISTTVIEVGVDVPNASIIIICDADRFGISQLHQLRGRIGRGRHPGVCLLLTKASPMSSARERLDAVAAIRDGFALADIDLEQRREGDVLGAAQSGRRSSLRLLRVLEHADLIETARDVVAEAIRRDPSLSEPGFVDAVAQLETMVADDYWDAN